MYRSFTYIKHSLLLTTVLLSNTFAASFVPETDELLLAPKCFVDNNSFTYTALTSSQSQQPFLFSVNRTAWLKQLETINHQGDCGKFINVNDEWEEYSATKKLNPSRISDLDYAYFLNDYLSSNKPSSSTFIKSNTGKAEPNQELLQTLYSELDSTRIWSSLDELTSFHNRASFTDTGVETAGHIKKWMEELAAKNNLTEDQFSVKLVATNGFYRQPSVVAVLGKSLPGEALVISAHMDTNGGGRRPGADDDGSGAMVVLESARLLVSAEQKFERPIYFIWYSAEEVGLVGSKKVVQEMLKDQIKIDSVLHFDTVGRRAKVDDPTLWLLTDHVNQDFTNYIADLIKNEVKVPVNFTRCGYACSDHASWDDRGFTATAAFESSFDDINPYLHTVNDVKEHVSLDNLVNYTKLAVAYAVDKGVAREPSSKKS